MAIEFFTEDFRHDGYNSTLTSSFQGQLASSYTTALTSVIKANGDWVGFLAHTVNDLDVSVATAISQAVLAGNFTLEGLFGAAQSTLGAVNPTDPVPFLKATVEGIDYYVNLTPILNDLDTETWTQSDTTGGGKKAITVTTYHTREFYTDADQPDGYTPDWANENPQVPVEGSYTTPAQTITNGRGNLDTFPVTFLLDNPNVTGEHDIHNIVLHVTGLGDYNGGGEGFTISGETGATNIVITGSGAPGPAGEGANGSSTFVNAGPLSVAVTDTDNDGTLEVTVQFTNQTAAASTVGLSVSFDYWL
jgi:hypothetical protein